MEGVALGNLLSLLFAPGFFHSSAVGIALLAGGVVALVSGVVGTFTVLRGQSFAGHALGDVGTTGGSAAFLVGASPLWGFVVAGMAGAGVMELFGIRRQRGRDLATGIVLGAALGIAALFLYFDATLSSTTGAAQTILFGSLFIIDQSVIPAVLVLSILAVGAVVVLYRPLLLSTLSPELAHVRGVPVRTVGVCYLLAMAAAVSMSCLTIGAILSTALLIGPAAASLRLTKSPGVAVGVSALIGIFVTLLGVVLAYDSFTWPPSGHGWPVSFFVVALVFVVYLLSGIPAWFTSRTAAAR